MPPMEILWAVLLPWYDISTCNIYIYRCTSSMSLKNQHYEHISFIQFWYRPFDTLWLGQAILMCWHGEMTSLKLPFQSIGKPSSSMKLFQNRSDHKNCGYCGTKLAYHASLQRASRKKWEVLPLSLIMKMMMFILTCWERTYPVPRHFWRWCSFSQHGICDYVSSWEYIRLSHSCFLCFVFCQVCSWFAPFDFDWYMAKIPVTFWNGGFEIDLMIEIGFEVNIVLFGQSIVVWWFWSLKGIYRCST